MSGGAARPAIVLLVLVAAISVVFLVARAGPTPGRAGTNASGSREPDADPAGALADLGPRLRGLRTSGGLDARTAQARARPWVEAARGTREHWSREQVHAALAHSDWAVRWAGCLAIHRYGPAGPELARRIAPLLSDEEEWVRMAAARGAAYVGEGFESLIPTLRTASGDASSDVRAVALRTLARRSARHPEHLDLFRDALADEDERVRGVAAYGIAQVELKEKLDGETIETLVGPLTRALADRASDVRMYAAMALGRAGPAAAPSMEGLLALLDDEVALVRSQAATSLGSLGTIALPLLDRALEADDGRRASHLLWALRVVGESAVPVLRKATRHTHAIVRVHAAMKLWELEDDVDATVRLLIDSLRSEDPEVVLQAARGLGRIGPAARAAIPALETHEEHADEALRRAVVGALGLITPER